jgi:hypothetical protein
MTLAVKTFRSAGLFALQAIALLGLGYDLGWHHNSKPNSPDAARFRKLSDEQAFDTKTGHTCYIVLPKTLPEGYVAMDEVPLCSEIGY